MGTILDGRYELMRHIGDGGMGAVYEAQHIATSRRVAVKVVHPSDSDDYEEVVERFQREARAGGVVNSPHIAQIFDAGSDSKTGCRYIAMEYLEGVDLATIMANQSPLEHRMALQIAGQCCAGLIKAHQAGIIHRDLKPSNIFLCRREIALDESSSPDTGDIIVKLVDFGIAKLTKDLSDTTPGNLTQTGGVIGSPRYMSPEQAQGLKTIDVRSDIWSLGVTLYEMLSGRTPTGDEDTFGRILLAICSKPAPPIEQFASQLPQSTVALVHRCLSLDADNRPQNARALLDDIHNCVTGSLALTMKQFGDLAEHFDPHPKPRTSGVNLTAYKPTMRSKAGALLNANSPNTITAVTARTGLLTSDETRQGPLPEDNTLAPRRTKTYRPLVLGGLAVAALGLGGLAALSNTAPSGPPRAPAAQVTAQTTAQTTALATPTLSASQMPSAAASVPAAAVSAAPPLSRAPTPSSAAPPPVTKLPRKAVRPLPTPNKLRSQAQPLPKPSAKPKPTSSDFGQFGPGF